MRDFKLPKLDFKKFVAFMVLCGTYGILWALTRHAVPPENKDLFNVLTGIVFNATIGRVMRALFPEKEELRPANKPTVNAD